MSIQTNLKEYTDIITEIKRLREVIKQLNKDKYVIEQKIITYLKTYDFPGIKYEGRTIMIKQTNIKKKNKEEYTTKEVLKIEK